MCDYSNIYTTTCDYSNIYASPVNCFVLCAYASWQMSSVLSFSATIYPLSPCTITFFSCVV